MKLSDVVREFLRVFLTSLSFSSSLSTKIYHHLILRPPVSPVIYSITSILKIHIFKQTVTYFMICRKKIFLAESVHTKIKTSDTFKKQLNPYSWEVSTGTVMTHSFDGLTVSFCHLGETSLVTFTSVSKLASGNAMRTSWGLENLTAHKLISSGSLKYENWKNSFSKKMLF